MSHQMDDLYRISKAIQSTYGILQTHDTSSDQALKQLQDAEHTFTNALDFQLTQLNNRDLS